MVTLKTVLATGLILAVFVGIIGWSFVSMVAGIDTTTPSPPPTATPMPSPTPSPTPTATPAPVVEPANNSITSTSTAYPDDSDDTFAALQEQAEKGILKNESRTTPDQQMINTTGNPLASGLLKYPWYYLGADGNVYSCYNDTNNTGDGFMWTPSKLQAAGYAVDRVTLWNTWKNSVTPHHDVTGTLDNITVTWNGRTSTDYDLDRNAIINESMLGATVTLRNNLVDDVVARIDVKTQLLRYDAALESYVTVDDNGDGVGDYDYTVKCLTIGLTPRGTSGATWTHEFQNLCWLDRTGYYRAVVTVTDHDDGVVLCTIVREAVVAEMKPGDMLPTVGG